MWRFKRVCEKKSKDRESVRGSESVRGERGEGGGPHSSGRYLLNKLKVQLSLVQRFRDAISIQKGLGIEQIFSCSCSMIAISCAIHKRSRASSTSIEVLQSDTRWIVHCSADSLAVA